MSDPARLMAYYGAFIERAMGLETSATDDGAALVFHDASLVYVLHNTASFDPGLIDLTVCLPNDENEKIKTEVCRAVVHDIPCLRAWVDDDGDIVLNVQSVAAGAHLTPRPEVLREVLPRLLDLLRYAVVRINQDTTLAGIALAST